jgi:hypothetical protein
MSARIEAGSRNYEFPNASPQGSHFLGETNSINFIDETFSPGNLKVQEAAGKPVPVEIQKQILLATPEFLTEMVFSNTPINEPDTPAIPRNGLASNLSAKQLAQLTQPNQPREPHKTHYLRPDVINTPQGQANVRFAKESERNRHLREFGHRIWVKLVQKALDEKQAPHAVHPLKELHKFNGMIVGLPNSPKYKSYREMMVARSQTTPEEILTLMEYEARNNLLTDSDKAEIYSMSIGDKTFARKFKELLTKQGIIPELLGQIPLTWDLISSLKISELEVIIILSYKLENDLFDKLTIETIKEMADNPANKELTDYLLSVQDQLTETPLWKIDLQDSETRQQIRDILQRPEYQDLFPPSIDDLNFGIPMDHQTRMSRRAMEAANEPPHDETPIAGQPFDLGNWNPNTDPDTDPEN